MDRLKFLNYFRKSVRLDSPIETDTAYKFSDDELWDIVEMAITAHNPLYNSTNVPDNELYFVLLKAKQEIYYRLATSSAPFYPIEAEGASLRKDYRFEHYMSLVRRIEQEYLTLWGKFESEQEIQVGNVLIDSYHYKTRNYNQANIPTVNILQCIPENNSICVEWSKFSIVGGLFNCYKIYVSTKPIYDEFDCSISPEAKIYASVTDIHKTKLRIRNLNTNTKYYLLISSEDRNGLVGYAGTTCTTLGVD